MLRKVIIFSAIPFTISWAQGQSHDNRHPAVQALVVWAEASLKDNVRPGQEIFRPHDQLVLKTINAEGADFDHVLEKLIVREKENLSFFPDEKDEALGRVVSKGQRRIPMIKQDDRWYCDLSDLFDRTAAAVFNERAKQDLASFLERLEHYRALGGSYPSNAQGLAALFQKPTTAPRPRRWIQTIAKAEDLNDPWGNPYQYEALGGTPRVFSLGPDGRKSEDDISSR